MIVGLMRLEIYIRSSRSLKDKRRIIKSLIEKVKREFRNLSVSEVGSNDLWKRSEIGIVIVSNDTQFVSSSLDGVLNYLKSGSSYEVISNNIELISF